MPNPYTISYTTHSRIRPSSWRKEEEEEEEITYFEKVTRNILIREEFKALLKEVLNEILDERETKKLNKKLMEEFELKIKRVKRNGKEML